MSLCAKPFMCIMKMCNSYRLISHADQTHFHVIDFARRLLLKEKHNFILSYLILTYLILSYLILSYLILSYLILSYLILSYLIAFSRNERTPPIFVCRREKARIFGLQFSRPYKFFSGAFGLVFVFSEPKSEARSSQFSRGPP